MELGRREIDPTAVDIGGPVCQTERLRPNDAAVNSMRFPLLEFVGLVGIGSRPVSHLFRLFKDREFSPTNHCLGAVIESDFLGVVSIGWRLDDDRHRTSRDAGATPNTIDIVSGDNARAGRENQMDWVSHDFSPECRIEIAERK